MDGPLVITTRPDRSLQSRTGRGDALPRMAGPDPER